MCGGGDNSVSQTYTPAKPVRQAIDESIHTAEDLKRQGYTIPTQQIAGFNPQQQQAFSEMQNVWNYSIPAYEVAKHYANDSAAPITEDDIGAYLNPWSKWALAGLNDDIGSRWKNQQGNLVQSAGGVGADRIAVGQAEGMRQNNLARGQLMSDFWGKALGAAQQEKGRQANASNLWQSIGTQGQNSALSGIQALFQSGAAQQGQEQRVSDADYAAALANIEAPWKANQYLADITGKLAPARGGTTTTTYPQQSPLGAIAGIGATVLGGLQMGQGVSQMFGGQGGMGGGGMSYPGYTNAMASFQNGQFAPMFVNTGGRIEDYAEGGAVNPYDMGMGYAFGGMPDGIMPAWPEMSGYPVPEGPGPEMPSGIVPAWPGMTQDANAGMGPAMWPGTPPAKTSDIFDELNPGRNPMEAEPTRSVAPQVTVQKSSPQVDAEALPPTAQPAATGPGAMPQAMAQPSTNYMPRQPQGGTLSNRLLEAGLSMLAHSQDRDSRGLPTGGLAAIGKGGLTAIEGNRKDIALDQKNISAEQRAKIAQDTHGLGLERLAESRRYHDQILTRSQQNALNGKWENWIDDDGTEGVIFLGKNGTKGDFLPGAKLPGKSGQTTTFMDRAIRELQKPEDQGGMGMTYSEALAFAKSPARDATDANRKERMAIDAAKAESETRAGRGKSFPSLREKYRREFGLTANDKIQPAE